MIKTLHVPSCVLRETALAIAAGPPSMATPQLPHFALPLIKDDLARSDQPSSAWPETWDTVPSSCPVCGRSTTSDPYLNGLRGPGWRCAADRYHYWMVRMEPLRRYLAAHPAPPAYPWYDATPAERQAWLDEHCHLPRLAPSNKGEPENALDRKTES